MKDVQLTGIKSFQSVHNNLHASLNLRTSNYKHISQLQYEFSSLAFKCINYAYYLTYGVTT
jgi:hypothetical protein